MTGMRNFWNKLDVKHEDSKIVSGDDGRKGECVVAKYADNEMPSPHFFGCNQELFFSPNLLECL